MITIKEEFLGSVKTQRAIELGGYEVLALWLALKGYADGGLTGGFIPDDDIGKLPGVPKNWKRLIPALLDCGKRKEDGSKGDGLIERRPYGWQLHDYIDHATPVGREELRREKERSRKANWRAGGVPGQQRDTVPGQQRDTVPGQQRDTVPGQQTGHSPARASAQPSRAPDPRPAPPSSDQLATSIQRPESSEPESGVLAAAAPTVVNSNGQIPCPADLQLLPAQAASLEISPMIPDWAQRAIRDEFVAAELGRPEKTMRIDQWRVCLSRAMNSRWSNSKTRPKKPEPEAGKAIRLEDLGYKFGSEGL